MEFEKRQRAVRHVLRLDIEERDIEFRLRPRRQFCRRTQDPPKSAIVPANVLAALKIDPQPGEQRIVDERIVLEVIGDRLRKNEGERLPHNRVVEKLDAGFLVFLIEFEDARPVSAEIRDSRSAAAEAVEKGLGLILLLLLVARDPGTIRKRQSLDALAGAKMPGQNAQIKQLFLGGSAWRKQRRWRGGGIPRNRPARPLCALICCRRPLGSLPGCGRRSFVASHGISKKKGRGLQASATFCNALQKLLTMSSQPCTGCSGQDRACRAQREPRCFSRICAALLRHTCTIQGLC